MKHSRTSTDDGCRLLNINLISIKMYLEFPRRRESNLYLSFNGSNYQQFNKCTQRNDAISYVEFVQQNYQQKLHFLEIKEMKY